VARHSGINSIRYLEGSDGSDGKLSIVAMGHRFHWYLVVVRDDQSKKSVRIHCVCGLLSACVKVTAIRVRL